MTAPSRITKEHSSSLSSSNFDANNDQAKPQPSPPGNQPQDFYSKLDEAVSNLENVSDDMLVCVPADAPISGPTSTRSVSDHNTSNPSTKSQQSDLHSGSSSIPEVASSAKFEFGPNPNPDLSLNSRPGLDSILNPRSDSRVDPANPQNRVADSAYPGSRDYPDEDGPSPLLPDELRGTLPGPGSSETKSTDSHFGSNCRSSTENRTSAIIPARRGLLSQDPWLNCLLAMVIAAGIGVFPAWEAGRRMHKKTVDPQILDLADAISRPLAVQDKTLRRPATIASDIENNYDQIHKRYYLVWSVTAGLFGFPLAIIRRKNPLASAEANLSST